MTKRPTPEVEARALTMLNEFMKDSLRLSAESDAKNYEIYREVSDFKIIPSKDGYSNNKVNFIADIEDKIVARLTKNPPRFDIKYLPEYKEGLQDGENIESHLKVVNLTLDKLMGLETVIDGVEAFLKGAVRHGYTGLIPEIREEYIYEKNDESDQGESDVVNNLKRTPIRKVPVIRNLGYHELLIDPRYDTLEDMPIKGVNIDRVRLSEIKRNKDYFNIEKLDEGEFKATYYNEFTPTKFDTKDVKIDKSAINLRKFWALFSESGEPEDEKFYKITCVAHDKDVVLIIGFEPAYSCSIIDMQAFKAPKGYQPTGVLERVIGLQRSYNDRDNKKSDFVNAHLRRRRFYDPKSGVSIKQLTGNDPIIVSKNVAKIEQYIKELELPQLSADVFATQSDVERLINRLSFQVDVNDEGAVGNNRIKFFDVNSVINKLRRNYERALEKLAYALLDLVYEHFDDIQFLQEDDKTIIKAHKSFFKNARTKLSLKVVPNSTDEGDQAQRNSLAISKFNFLKEAAKELSGVKLRKSIMEVLETYPDTNPSSYFDPLASLPNANPNVSPSNSGAGDAKPIEQKPSREAIEIQEIVSNRDAK